MLALWIRTIEKTLIKITILTLIFSLFLEIRYKNIVSYIIFLGIIYVIGFLYISYKISYKVCVNYDYLLIKNFFSSHKIKYENITDLFLNEGFLQRKFNLNSIYIITKHKNYLLKDLPDGQKIFDDIEKKLKNKNI